MRRFTELYLALDGTNAVSEKTEALVHYLESAPPADAAWVVALLTGNRPRGLGASRLLRTLCLEVTGHPDWLLEECRTAVGDLSETIALLLPPPERGCDDSLDQVMRERVLPLRDADDDGRRELIRSAWSALDAEQRLVHHKLIRGGFRVGVRKSTVVRALARLAGLDVDLMAHRLTGRFEPTADAFRALLQPARPREHRERPYPFLLAHPLAVEPASLGPVTDWVLEDKWDGIRAQLMIRSGDRRLWSRGEEPIGHQFPELLAVADLPDDTVLDGEVLLWSGDRPRPFHELQTRLNRNRPPEPQLELFSEVEARFVAYDLLEEEGTDLRDRPLEERRRRLACLLERLDSPSLAPSRPHEPADWTEAARLRATARARGTEGLMLKRRASRYGVGRVRGEDGWLKWKLDPHTADAVMIGAQPGSGRRASLYTDYTFAIWDRTAEEPVLVSFAKAYSGLEQGEIERLDRWIRKNTVARNGPFRAVRPEQVFEIAFDGIQRSGRHRSGLAVRFPRILRWREDKPAAEADDTATLTDLLEATWGAS